MLNRLAICASFVPALALGGCGTVEGLFSTNPAVNQTSLTQLTAIANVYVCDISALASVASNVEAAAQASKSITGTTGKVLAASTAACSGLGALTVGTVSAPAGATVIQ